MSVTARSKGDPQHMLREKRFKTEYQEQFRSNINETCKKRKEQPDETARKALGGPGGYRQTAFTLRNVIEG